MKQFESNTKANYTTLHLSIMDAKMIEMKLINITHIDPIDGMVHIYGAVQRRFDLIGNAHVERIDLLMDDKVNKH